MYGLIDSAIVLLGVLLLVLSGFPLSYYLLRRRKPILRLVSVLFMGPALLVILDYSLAVLQVSFAFTFYFMILFSIFSIFFIFRNWKKIEEDVRSCQGELLALFLLFVIVSIMLMLPLILTGSLHRIVGVNGDYELHASVADHIAESNIYAPMPNTSYYAPVYDYVFGYMGPKAFQVILAFLVKFSGMQAYSIYMMVSALTTALGVFSLYLLCRKFGLGEIPSLLATFLTMFSQALVFFYLDNFAPQLLGFAIFPMAFVLFTDALESKDRYLALASAILVSFLLSSHPLSAAIFLLSAFFFFVFRLLQTRKKFAETLFLCILIFLAAAVVNPRSAYDYAVTTLVHVKSTGGNIYYFPPVGALFGLELMKAFSRFSQSPLPEPLIILIEILVVPIGLLGLYGSIKKRNYGILSVLCSIALYAMVTWFLNETYEFSKAVPFITFVFLSFMFMYLEGFLQLDRRIKLISKKGMRELKDGKVVAVLFTILLYVFGMAAVTVPTIYGYSAREVMGDRVVEYYRWLNAEIPPNSAVYFSAVARQEFWAVYFLRNYDVCTPDNTYVKSKIYPKCENATEAGFGKFDVVVIGSDVINEENISIKDGRFPFKYFYALNGGIDNGSFEHQESAWGTIWGPDAFYILSKKEFTVAPEDNKTVCSIADKTCYDMIVSSNLS